MRFDEASQAFVIDQDFCLPARFFINEGHDIPAHGRFEQGLRVETRVMRCTFENRWSLSIIWGSMTYGTNKDHPYGDWRGLHYPDFVEEPDFVEVGIIMPDERIVPEQDFGDALHTLGSKWKGPTTMPEHKVELWGDPLGWVDAAGVRYLVGVVSRFDSHDYPNKIDGPTLERNDDGTYSLDFTIDTEEATQEGTPCPETPSATPES